MVYSVGFMVYSFFKGARYWVRTGRSYTLFLFFLLRQRLRPTNHCTDFLLRCAVKTCEFKRYAVDNDAASLYIYFPHFSLKQT